MVGDGSYAVLLWGVYMSYVGETGPLGISKPMRLHIISQPHTQLTQEYVRCAYTQKIVKLCKMLVNEGMEVFVYGGEDNETPATLITCVTKKVLSKLGYNSPETYLNNDYDITKPLWQYFHSRCISHLREHLLPGDFIGTFSGRADQPIAAAFPKHRFIELGIGYSGVFSEFRVYESSAWANASYGATMGNAAGINGRFYDTVIPNYFDPNDFPYSEHQLNYYLFMGRMIQRKGIQIIGEIAKRMPDSGFLMVGQGAKMEGNKIICDDHTVIEGDNLQYLPPVDAERRGELMSQAKALICPTIYLPPFEGVHVEAMMCGTPVLTSPYGCFRETFEDGVHGFRCHNIKQFVEGAYAIEKLDRLAIREYAQNKYSMEVVAKQYVKYFQLLQGLDRGGFYEPNEPISRSTI